MTVFPNYSGSTSLRPRSARNRVRPSTGGGRPTHERLQSTATSISHDWQKIADDAYHISTVGKTLLQSTFIPTDSRRPIYEVTTDIATHNNATTILWSCDLQRRRVTEVARIKWSASGKAVVEMGGLCVPVAELLTKPRWRLSMSP